MSRFRGQLEAILASLSFGIAPVFAKKGYLSGVHALSGMTIGLLAGLLVNIFFVVLTREWKKFASASRHGFFFALIGGGCNTIAAVTYFWAMSLGKVAPVVPITCIYPLFTLITAALFLRKTEALDLWTVIGTLLIVGGIILTV